LIVITFRDAYPDTINRGSLFFAAIAAGASFSLFQRESITWSFNVHFVLLFLLPLLSFRALFRLIADQSSPRRVRNWTIYIVFGLLSAATLASGTVIFFIAAIGAFTFGRIKLAIGSFLLGVVVALLYFGGLSNQSDGASVLTQFNPITAGQYFLLLLANPFWQFSPQSGIGLYLCLVIGIMVFAGATLMIWRLLLSKSRSLSSMVFGMMICYSLVSLMFIAIGRSHFGLWQAGMSRYATPALALYVCLFAVFIGTSKRPAVVRAGVALAMASLLITQVVFATRENFKMFQYSVASVAIDLDIHDTESIDALAVVGVDVFHASKAAAAQNISIFASKELIQLKSISLQNKLPNNEKATNCVPQIESVAQVTGGWFRTTGYLSNEGLPASLNPAYFAVEFRDGSLAVGAVASRFLNRRPGIFTVYSRTPPHIAQSLQSRCLFELNG